MARFDLSKNPKRVNESFSHLKMFDLNLRNENNLEMNVFDTVGSKIVELEIIRYFSTIIRRKNDIQVRRVGKNEIGTQPHKNTVRLAARHNLHTIFFCI